MIWFLKWRIACLTRTLDRLLAKTSAKAIKLSNMKKRVADLIRENAGRDLPHD